MRNRHPKVHPGWRLPAGLMLLGWLLAWPSVGAAEDASCSLSPRTVNVGGTVNWSASVSGFRSSRTYRWTLGGGTPSSSTSPTPAVKYNTVGTFETKLRVDDSRNDDECKTNVTVRASSSDTQAPTTPSNLTATALSSSQINLSWNVSTDNVGVTGYRIYRCQGSSCTPSTQVGTATTTSYSDTGLTANTQYRYRVRATDAASNLSSYSSTRSATTLQGQQQSCTISVNPTSLAFGNVNVGANAARSTTVTNTGTAACALTVARTGTTEFALTTPATINVAIGGSATVSATYTPTAAGADTGNLAISGSGITTVNVAMTGTGVAVQAQCNPAVDGDHRNCIVGEYTGPEVCVACHETQARNMHSSVHYQQNGPTDFVTNIAGNAGEGPAGKPSGVNAVIGINTYCGTHENSPRFTCAGCHVGNGRFPKTAAELAALPALGQREELANIDCLTCHQEVYKRFPDWVLPGDPNFVGGEGYGFEDLVLENVTTDASGNLVPSVGSTVTRSGFAGIPLVDLTTLDFRFRPAGAAGSVIPFPAGAPLPGGPMALTTEQAAQTVHPTTRQSCLNCHAGAAGANGAKRGDLSTSNIASTDLTLDRHMATTGSNMTCSECHNVDDTPTVDDAGRPTTHRVRGRGLDLRANDHATRFTCDNAGCHNAATVHNAVTNGATFNGHAAKVACQTCHIPRYGKGVATEIARDWQTPHVTQTACNGRGGWLPEEIKSSTATPPAPLNPTYQWFDGTSQVYYLTETLTNTPRKALPANIATAFGMPTNTQAYVMGRPNGAANVAAAKIYPMKEHWGKLARNVSVSNPEVPVNSLIPQSTFEFFRTGSFCRSVAEGLGQNPDTACLAGQDTEAPAGTEVVAVHTYQTVNHGVEPQANSLGANNTCGTCHDVAISPFTTGKPLRMFLERDMGYAVTRAGITAGTNGTYSCSVSCHGTQTGNFTNIHSRSQHRNAGCNACHSGR